MSSIILDNGLCRLTWYDFILKKKLQIHVSHDFDLQNSMFKY